jgi:hypothetical protein
VSILYTIAAAVDLPRAVKLGVAGGLLVSLLAFACAI